jgi:hypothetical protein
MSGAAAAVPGRVGDGAFSDSGSAQPTLGAVAPQPASPEKQVAGAKPAAGVKPVAAKSAPPKGGTTNKAVGGSDHSDALDYSDDGIGSSIELPDEDGEGNAGEDARATEDGKDGETKEGDTPLAFTVPALPEGMTADVELVGKLGPVLEKAKAAGFTQDLFDEMVGVYSEHLQALEGKRFESEEKAYKDQQKGFVATLKADPEWGGARYEATRKLAGVGLAKIFGRDALKDFELVGLANKPEIVIGLAKLGKMFSERSLVLPGAVAQKDVELSDEEVLFGNRK